MAAVDQLPPMPTRGADDGAAAGGGDLSSLFKSNEEGQEKADVQEVMQKMRQRVGQMMREVETIAQQFPAASKEADLAMKAFDAMLRAIVKNSPTPEQSSPMVPA